MIATYFKLDCNKNKQLHQLKDLIDSADSYQSNSKYEVKYMNYRKNFTHKFCEKFYIIFNLRDNKQAEEEIEED